jgi:hypothetical protein
VAFIIALSPGGTMVGIATTDWIVKPEFPFVLIAGLLHPIDNNMADPARTLMKEFRIFPSF